MLYNAMQYDLRYGMLCHACRKFMPQVTFNRPSNAIQDDDYSISMFKMVMLMHQNRKELKAPYFIIQS